METRTSFTQAHLENQLWINELEFYREELGIFDKHLPTLVTDRSSKEISDKAYMFRNQFERFRERINVMETELNTAGAKMAMYAKEAQSTDLDEVNVADHYQFREKVENFKKEYEQLKTAFKNFEFNSEG